MVVYCDIQKLQASKEAQKWWDANAKKGGQKWETLRHNGVLFPPEYEPLPKNVKVLHKGKPISLDSVNRKNPFNITAEEGAVFFAMKLEQDDRLAEKNAKRKKAIDDKTFVKNFWNDWKVVLGKNHEIKSLSDVDFTPIQKYIAKRSETKKASTKSLTKEEKKEAKEGKEQLKELYGYAVVDGTKIPLGSYIVQPPGLYIGHGKQPLRGKIKKRIEPSDITLNVSKNYVPRCEIAGKPCVWGKIVEDKEVEWIASWRNPITNEINYVWLKREASEWACGSDIQKFEKARDLGKAIKDVRKKYMADLNSTKDVTRQLATAVYLLDVIAIRPGTEKDESKEAETQGLTTLKCGNMRFDKGTRVTLDFIGKSSIQFTKTFEVDKKVYSNLKELCSGKGKKDGIFPNINSNSLNDYLKTLLPNLTAKVFRTYKASSILQEQLSKNIPKIDTDTHTKKIIYDKVNIEVAMALNHKKMGGSDSRIEKLKAKSRELKEKQKSANTPKQKASVKKSIDLNKAKLMEAEHNISTSTSKVNYIDPRITVAWCKKVEMPIEKIYTKPQLGKFVWAMEIPSIWKF